MNGSLDPSLIGDASEDIDPKVVRSEAIRAIRGFIVRSGEPTECRPGQRRPVTFYAIVRIMRDLELTLAAISESLAEGAEHVRGSSSGERQSAASPSTGSGTGKVNRQASGS